MPDRSDPNHDKLYRIRPFLDRIVSAFSEAHAPSRDIAVDESIIGFKGRLSWIQYMPKNPTKWGIKAWVLADSRTGYVYNLKLYSGNSKAIPVQVIIKLCH